MRKYVYTLIAVLAVLACMITGEATAADREKEFGCVLEIPSDFSFSVQDRCSGHSYFHHAVAQDDGTVAVFSHHIDPKGKDPKTFEGQYVDIYNSDGVLEKELSFRTTQAYASALENDKLYLYFYSYVIAIDLETDALHCYDIADMYVADRNDVTYQQSKTFMAGEWEYECVQALSGYKKLVRTNDTTRQVVVDITNNALSVGAYIVPALCAVLIVALGLLVRKHKKCGHKTEPDTF